MNNGQNQFYEAVIVMIILRVARQGAPRDRPAATRREFHVEDIPYEQRFAVGPRRF
jgi:hypothetical protein